MADPNAQSCLSALSDTRSISNTEQKQPRIISRSNTGLRIRQQSRASFKSHTNKSSLGRFLNCSGTNRRHVSPTLLSRLTQLYQHTTLTGLAALTCTLQHGVSAFHGFNSQHNTVLNDASLTDIQPAQFPNHFNTAFDVRTGYLIRPMASEGTRAPQRLRQEFMRAPDSETLFSKNSDKRSQQPVITSEKRSTKTRKDTGAFCIRTKITEGRSAHRADQDDVATVMLAKFRQDRARSGQTHVSMRPWLDDSRLGKILKGDNKNISPLRGDGGSHLPRQGSASRKNTNATSRCVRSVHCLQP